MGNCCVKCKNSKKIKKKTKKYHHHHIRRDNGDILNHIDSQISPLNISSNLQEKFIFPQTTEKAETTTTTTTTIDASKTTASTTYIDIQLDEHDSQFDTKPIWKKHYRSLQKSKKSIKQLEETLKNSNSIEHWLNQVSLNDTQTFLNTTKQLDDTINQNKSSSQSSIESNDDLHHFENHSLINELYELNQNCNYNELETKYKLFIKSFFIPRSLSYTQDIQLLKWLINNFTLNLYQPLNQQKFYSSYDKLIKIQKRLYLFLLQPLDLSIDLAERDDNNSTIGTKNELLYEYYHENDQIRGKLRLKQTEPTIADENDETVKSRKLFLFNFLKTSNSVSTTSLLNSKLKLVMSPVCDTSKKMSTSSNFLSYYDLNERLFTCFLSNFSCQLAENFIKSLHEYHISYIRKSNLNDYFSYIEISKQQQAQAQQTLNVDEYRFKLCLKLNSWPVYYESEYFARKDRVEWPSRKQLVKLRLEMCLLVNELPNLVGRDDDNDTMNLYYWTVDYSLAETYLFRTCLNKKQKYYYYLFYYILRDLILNEVEIRLDHCNSEETLTEPLKYINYERLFMHHYFRFLELYSADFYRLNSLSLVRNFFSYICKIGNLNKLNYFCSKFSIELNFSAKHNELVSLNVKKLETMISLSKVCSTDDLISYLKLNFVFCGDGLLMISCKNWCFQSKFSYIYEYIYDYTCFLYQEFYLRRDNFKITEELLISINNEIVKKTTIFSLIDVEHIDYCYLLNQYEVYAEYVNKYLSQIRNYNQYLLFHYIWTMQVQYLTPFFNYIIDKYKIF
jgi:hypothetical protein